MNIFKKTLFLVWMAGLVLLGCSTAQAPSLSSNKAFLNGKKDCLNSHGFSTASVTSCECEGTLYQKLCGEACGDENGMIKYSLTRMTNEERKAFRFCWKG